MLKVDKQRIEQLASNDEVQRVSAAQQLDALERGYFEEHPLSRKFVVDRQKALLLAYQQTDNALVREWIVQVLADAQVHGVEMVQMVKSALHLECNYLTTLLYYMLTDTRPFRDCKEAVKILATHANPEVRWRCASFLECIPLDYDADIAALRKLMLDEDELARLNAVLALKHLRRLEPEDRAILNQVLQMEGGARAYAMDILASDWATS